MDQKWIIKVNLQKSKVAMLPTVDLYPYCPSSVWTMATVVNIIVVIAINNIVIVIINIIITSWRL